MPSPKRDDPIPALKRQLANAIVAACDGWTQWNAAVLLGIDQPRISDLRNGRLERFSLDQLVRLLVRADASVELRLTSTKRSRIFKSINAG
ncbi:MAG: XRE family transcriptional regulator [bacterium]